MSNPTATSSPFQQGTFGRDDNYVPITQNGLIVSKAMTLTGNNTTVATPLFTVTGEVLVNALYGVVTTALGSNVTTAFWRFNDGSAQAAISLATGTTISSFVAGSVLSRISLVSVALSAKNATSAGVVDPVAATAPSFFMPFVLTQKTGAVASNVEFSYATTNTPTTGAITFYLGYVPLSAGSNVVAL